jgi:hypothetical protein
VVNENLIYFLRKYDSRLQILLKSTGYIDTVFFLTIGEAEDVLVTYVDKSILLQNSLGKSISQFQYFFITLSDFKILG